MLPSASWAFPLLAELLPKGPVAVQGVRPLPGSGRVYNLEIHGQRVYRIGSPGVLVHNSGGGCPLDDLPPELRQKIHGTAQQTKTPGHAETINRIAAEAAKDPRVVAIHLNHGYNRALELPPKTITPNRRPDTAIIYDDKAVRRIEVPSKSDDIESLMERHTALDDQIRAQGYEPRKPEIHPIDPEFQSKK